MLSSASCQIPQRSRHGIHIRPFRVSRSDCLVWNCLVGIAGQGRTNRLGLYGKSRPSKVRLPVHIELETQIVILEPFPAIRPRSLEGRRSPVLQSRRPSQPPSTKFSVVGPDLHTGWESL